MKVDDERNVGRVVGKITLEPIERGVVGRLTERIEVHVVEVECVRPSAVTALT